MSAAGRELKESYSEQATKQYKKKPIDTAKLSVVIHLFWGDRRKRDIDNYHKLSLDSLTGIVWVDDSQIEKMVVYKGYDKDNPRIEIEIDEYREQYSK